MQLTSSSRSVICSEISGWFRRAVSQNSGIPFTSAASFSSLTSVILAPSSSSSSSSSESAFWPASISASVGSTPPATMAARRSYRGLYLSRNCPSAWASVNDDRTHLLLQLQDGELELALNLGVLLLHTLEAVDPPLDGRRQVLDVARRAPNEALQPVLREGEKSRVLARVSCAPLLPSSFSQRPAHTDTPWPAN